MGLGKTTAPPTFSTAANALFVADHLDSDLECSPFPSKHTITVVANDTAAIVSA